jgi:hypothetical protein
MEHLLHSSIDGQAPFTEFPNYNLYKIFYENNKISPVMKIDISKDNFVKKFIFTL